MEISLFIPYPTPTLNDMLRDAWRKYQKRQWQRSAAEALKYGNWGALQEVKQHFPLRKCRIVICRYERGGGLDPDNLYASVKPLMDILQPVSRSNKYGLGIIADDSSKVVRDLVVKSLGITSEDRRGTVISIYA